MRWVLIVLAVVAGLAALAVVVGMMRPRGHVARTQAEYARTPEEVWAVLADFEHWSDWNPEVKSVEPLADRNGHRVLNVVGTWGRAETELVEWDPASRLGTAMDAGSFRGRWTYALEPVSGGTRLTITEEGEVDNPLFRAMMIFHDNHATMMSFHRALAERLGVTVEPSEVPAGG